MRVVYYTVVKKVWRTEGSCTNALLKMELELLQALAGNDNQSGYRRG